MNYIGNIIRPPSEADSIILQVTVGCSHNKCTFCGAYKDQPFTVKDSKTIDDDLNFASRYCRNQTRVFLADGDALILSQEKLTVILKKIRRSVPWARRVSLYGNGLAIRSKTTQQLRELKSLGLDRVYLGLESGSAEILDFVNKKESPESMIAAGKKVKDAGLFLSVTCLLGLAGIEKSARHAIETARVLNTIAPNQVAILSYLPLANTPLGQAVADGSFTIPQPDKILGELRLIIENISGIKCQFHANHGSNYLPLSGRLPRDRQFFLDQIEKAQYGKIATVPEFRRTL
ncbi:radical SAM protein [Desulforhopalus singaporensis]|uniref:Fe-S oxidoreductase n=1 Tax=Desulforhopalus singaporensis TaxID=91360 RepID=A0A1H0QJ08_9BACT|nr:radical SAM protein [Desulforhopalus singaporensis]SDP17297.1 Fe-S oxidoreductase [Desulforhopalus singaporensis]